MNGAAITPDAAEAETLRGASLGGRGGQRPRAPRGVGPMTNMVQCAALCAPEPSRAAGTDATGTHGFSDDV